MGMARMVGRMGRTSGALMGLGLLAGCAAFDPALQDIDTVQPTGNAFSVALTEEYRSLSHFEEHCMFDYVDAAHFANKGMSAAGGQTPLPADPAEWNLTADQAADVSSVRRRLLGLLDGGARTGAPALAAEAQSRFDCWVEQLEENHQDSHIATCREDLFYALSRLEQQPAPAAQAEPAPAPAEPVAEAPQPQQPGEPLGPIRYIIFFDFDSAVVDDQGQRVIEQLRQDYPMFQNPIISLVGYTDTSGSSAYNLRLSQRRAAAVEQALVSAGLPGQNLDADFRGETNPRVDTGDGVRERRNRRVEIQINDR